LKDKSTSSSERRTVEKKPYQRPRLDVYGDIREIAKSVGMQGGADGAPHGQTKTQ
jgi:hypothetical protein